MYELPNYRDVLAEVDRLELSVDASELHGSLCGYLCAGGDRHAADWLGRLAIGETNQAVAPAGGALVQLFQVSAEQLQSPDFGFDLLLPAEDNPVSLRADALLGWCRGFLGGFGLAAGAHPPLSAEAGEALEDLGRIAGSQLSYEDPEADEEALAEVAEFVRVAALLLHGDCVLAREHRQRLH